MWDDYHCKNVDVWEESSHDHNQKRSDEQGLHSVRLQTLFAETSERRNCQPDVNVWTRPKHSPQTRSWMFRESASIISKMAQCTRTRLSCTRISSLELVHGNILLRSDSLWSSECSRKVSLLYTHAPFVGQSKPWTPYKGSFMQRLNFPAAYGLL